MQHVSRGEFIQPCAVTEAVQFEGVDICPKRLTVVLYWSTSCPLQVAILFINSDVLLTPSQKSYVIALEILRFRKEGVVPPHQDLIASRDVRSGQFDNRFFSVT